MMIHRRIKRILAFFLALLLLGLCGCAPRPEDGTSPKDEVSGGARDQRSLYLTLWSWQITSAEDAEAYAQKALDCGFTAVDFSVLWSAFEPLEGHFDWTYLDRVVSVFTEKGLNVSLQPLLWTKDLAWAEDLALQETKGRGVYEVEGRGSFVSFTDAETLNVVKHTLQAFAAHAAESYGSRLVRWGVRLSCFGEFDYSVNEDLDYSASAARGFYDYLKDAYGSWQSLDAARGLGISSRKELESLGLETVSKACRGDWRRYRQEVLFSFAHMVSDIFRSADASVPLLFSLGSFGNGMNTLYSGVVDLWSGLNSLDFDIVSVSFADGVEPAMLLSLVTSLTSKRISAEVDGAWALEEGRDIASQVALCGTYRLFSLSTANFTLEQLDAQKETLSSYQRLFFAENNGVKEADPASPVLILSNGIVQQNAPDSYGVLYGDVWNALSEQGTRRVRFLTEAQLASGEVSLTGVEMLYTGALTGEVPVQKEFIKNFLSSDAVLSGKPLTFVHLDGSDLPRETAALAALRLSDGK